MRLRWATAFAVSLGGHALFLLVLLPAAARETAAPGASPDLRIAKDPPSRRPSILVDLKAPDEKDAVNEKNDFLSTVNRQGHGRLTDDYGLNKSGDRLQEMSASRIAKNAQRLPDRGDRSIDPTREDHLGGTFGLRTRPDLRTTLRLGDAGADFAIGSEKWEYAEFYQSFFNALVPVFKAYAEASPWAARMLREDSVTVLAAVTAEGRVEFRRMIRNSARQPWLDHVMQGSLENAGRARPVPTGLLRPGESFLEIPLTLVVAGQPPLLTLTVPRPEAVR